jgi:hypothetical protein
MIHGVPIPEVQHLAHSPIKRSNPSPDLDYSTIGPAVWKNAEEMQGRNIGGGTNPNLYRAPSPQGLDQAEKPTLKALASLESFPEYLGSNVEFAEFLLEREDPT